jgi:hypothetical protein
VIDASPTAITLAARLGEPAQVFPPMPHPPTDDRGWMA